MLTQFDGRLGFDLDGYDTRTGDGPGCGKIDAEGGIDAQFARLIPALSEFGFFGHDRVTEALTEGAIRFELALRDYDGGADDACVWSRFELDGIPGGDFVPGVVVDGTLEVSGGEYQVYAPFPNMEDFFRVDVESARVSVPLDGSEATLGGTAPWYGPLRNQLLELIREISDSIDAATVDAIVLPQADMRTPEAPPGTCDALSFGVDARFERVEE